MTALQRHARFTAWLGLIAMWLVVCAPLVSQLVMAARVHDARDPVDPVAVLCSAMTPSATSSTASWLAPSHTAAHHDGAANSLAACGYCDLLATHTAMPSLPPVAVQVLTLVAIVVVPVLSVRFTPLGAFPSGRPRAPPFAS